MGWRKALRRGGNEILGKEQCPFFVSRVHGKFGRLPECPATERFFYRIHLPETDRASLRLGHPKRRIYLIHLPSIHFQRAMSVRGAGGSSQLRQSSPRPLRNFKALTSVHLDVWHVVVATERFLEFSPRFFLGGNELSNLTCAYFSNGLVQPPTRKNNGSLLSFFGLYFRDLATLCLWDYYSPFWKCRKWMEMTHRVQWDRIQFLCGSLVTSVEI